MNRREKAMNYFKEGYNCAQAVVLAYSDLLEMDESTLAKLSSSFGGGFGRMREICGSKNRFLRQEKDRVFLWERH